jgi:hypothetical protein
MVLFSSEEFLVVVIHFPLAGSPVLQVAFVLCEVLRLVRLLSLVLVLGLGLVIRSGVRHTSYPLMLEYVIVTVVQYMSYIWICREIWVTDRDLYINSTRDVVTS